MPHRITKDELEEITDTLTIAHDPDVMVTATMAHFANHLLAHFGAANSVSLTAYQVRLNDCVLSWLRERAIPLSAYQRAQNALAQAGATINYINTLPQ
jgi:hypothetical protein